MQGPKRHWSVVATALTLATVVAGACQSDLPTEVAPLDPAPAYARKSAPAYTNLGVLAGDNESRANGVNDAGEVVGYSCCSPQSRGFVRLAGVLTALAGEGGNALAISNGSTRYAVGWAGSTSSPVRWTIVGNIPGQPVSLGLGSATWGAALGVNDAGEAVGHAGIDAAMWDASGNLTLVPAPAGFARGEGRDIENAGHAAFVFQLSNGRAVGHLRLASGDLVPLPPIGADIISYANSVTPATADLVQVAGSSYSDPSSSRAVRWTVNIATKQIVAAEVRSEASHAVGLSHGSIAVGFLEGSANSLNSTAFRWGGSTLLPVNPPKGMKSGKAWATSPNGIFVAGEAVSKLSRRAILWTFPSP